VLPNHDRELLQLNDIGPLPVADGKNIKTTPPRFANKAVIFQFSPDKLVALKAAATASLSEQERKTNWLSTIDAVIMVIWRALVRARQLPANLMLVEGSAVNLRFQFESLPSNYFGNAINLTNFTKTVGEILNSSLGSLAVAHRQAVSATKAISKEDWLGQADVTSQLSQAERGARWKAHTDYVITDWSKFGYYTADFGDGIPARCRRFSLLNRTMVCLFDMPPLSQDTTATATTTSSSGIEAYLNIEKVHYTRLINDREFSAFAKLVG
jgi:hypothetical protein